MPSDFLSPFLELDEEFCKTLRSLETSEDSQHARRVLGFQRRHSLCPVTLPNSKFNSSGSDLSEPACWGLSPAPEQLQPQQWTREGRLPRSALSHIPFRVDRSVSLIEGGREDKASRAVLQPPPGLCLSTSSLTSLTSPSSPPTPAPHITTRYKTELCRTYEESGTCKYGAKCQFAHGMDEMRGLNRHPKYKTEPCRTFHTIGFCPYGARCHFIHNADELAPPPPPRPKLSHSLSFAGFSSAHLFTPVEEETPPPSLLFARASSTSPPPSSSVSPELLSPLFPEPAALNPCPRPFSGLADLPRDVAAAALRFYAANDSVGSRCPASKKPNLPYHLPQQPALTLSGLQRCSSADSLSEEGYTSSCSLSSSSSGAESPSLEGRRLPIFSRLSVSDE